MRNLEVTEQELEVLLALVGQANATGIEAMAMVLELHRKLQEARDAAQERENGL